MAQDEIPYPKLYELYLEHLEHRVDYTLLAFLVFIVVATGVLIQVRFNGPSDYLLVAAILLFALYFILKLTGLTHGMSRKELGWRRVVKHIEELQQTSGALERVERELEEDHVIYPDFILTRSHIVSFRNMEQGAIAPLRDVQVVIKEYYSGSNFSIVESRVVYAMHMNAPPLGEVFLTRKEDEMRDIFYEIRSRYPDVPLDEGAHSYFFPSSVSVEE